jgi:galactonate dehydratase
VSASDIGQLEAATLTLCRVTPKTIWAFLDTRYASGAAGLMEVTLPNRDAALVQAFEQLPDALLLEGAREAAAADPMPVATILNGLAFARADAAARIEGLSLASHLGRDGSSVPVYANINRRTVDRSPEGFAASARHAFAKGYRAFKIAPFDEVTVAACAAGDGERLMQAGLRRLSGVRDAIGPQCDLMADCHWRFDAATAARLTEAIRPLNLHWLECPVPETDEFMPVLKDLRARVNAAGTRLAGLEEFTGADSFLRFARAGCYDVMMPDVKYIGGPEELWRTAERLAMQCVEVSPHNPTGPVCHAVSAHVSGGLPGFTRLEMQIDETPLFDALAQVCCPPPEAAMLRPPPGPGHGIALSAATVAATRVLTVARSFRRHSTAA